MSRRYSRHGCNWRIEFRAKSTGFDAKVIILAIGTGGRTALPTIGKSPDTANGQCLAPFVPARTAGASISALKKARPKITAED